MNKATITFEDREDQLLDIKIHFTLEDGSDGVEQESLAHLKAWEIFSGLELEGEDNVGE